MEEKLQQLYNDCIKELETIKIDILNNPLIGEIDISLAKRDSKKYGCCKQEDPDIKTGYVTRKRNTINIKYDRYNKHHIEISKWVMKLDDSVIKNTIMHEIIHCFPGCNNHGTTFKNYASYINQKLGYNIKRLGDKEADYKLSNLDFEKDEKNYNYKIECQDCGLIIYRKRLKKDLVKKYRCGKCGGKLKII